MMSVLNPRSKESIQFSSIIFYVNWRPTIENIRQYKFEEILVQGMYGLTNFVMSVRVTAL